jgi:hypothetical protein
MKSDYIAKQYLPVGLQNGETCVFCEIRRIFKSYVICGFRVKMELLLVNNPTKHKDWEKWKS